jgi:hypothetical protein
VTKLAKQKYRHYWRCRICAGRFSTVRYSADATAMSPRCPKKTCGGKTKESFVADKGLDVSEGRAPGVIGANVQTAAYDAAMNITMQDQGLGDIQDHSRPGAVQRAGEPTAPKLPQHLQSQADNFWGQSQQNKQKTRTAKVDLTPVFGQRAVDAGAGSAQFKSEAGSAIAPILKHRPPGSSPIPAHVVIAG